MRKDEHIGLTILLAIPITTLFYFIGLIEYLYFILPMFLTTMLPDILEPATNYKHRGFFHSKTTLKFLSVYCLAPLFILGFAFNFLFYLFFGIIGYISHLLGDWTTPMGLPN